jgi:methionine aminopeptidase
MFKKFRGVNKLHISNLYNIPAITGDETELDSYILAGNIHKNIRFDIQNNLKVGSSIYELSELINKKTRQYCKNVGYNGGIAFPPILSVNNCIAHCSPTKDTDILLKYDDNVKIDFGVHVNGYIVDCAFSTYFNEKHDDIHKACYEALNEGLKYVGIDGYIKDCSKAIQEIVDSYDFKVIKGVNGHSVNRYNVHGGININNYSTHELFNKQRFTKGAYAIEPFISYKTENYYDGNNANNYRVSNKNMELYKYFNNLIFTDSHVKYYDINNIFQKEKHNLHYYPPLYIKRGDIGVQYEHTVYVDNDKTINISKGIDY